MTTMCSENTLPKPGFCMRFWRSPSDIRSALGCRSKVGAVSTVLMVAPSSRCCGLSVFGAGAGRMDQAAEAGDALLGDGRIVGGEVEAEAVGAAAVREEERARREAETVAQGLLVEVQRGGVFRQHDPEVHAALGLRGL